MVQDLPTVGDQGHGKGVDPPIDMCWCLLDVWKQIRLSNESCLLFYIEVIVDTEAHCFPSEERKLHGYPVTVSKLGT